MVFGSGDDPFAITGCRIDRKNGKSHASSAEKRNIRRFAFETIAFIFSDCSQKTCAFLPFSPARAPAACAPAGQSAGFLFTQRVRRKRRQRNDVSFLQQLKRAAGFPICCIGFGQPLSRSIFVFGFLPPGRLVLRFIWCAAGSCSNRFRLFYHTKRFAVNGQCDDAKKNNSLDELLRRRHRKDHRQALFENAVGQRSDQDV